MVRGRLPELWATAMVSVEHEQTYRKNQQFHSDLHAGKGSDRPALLCQMLALPVVENRRENWRWICIGLLKPGKI